jgi:hypothetical protein
MVNGDTGECNGDGGRYVREATARTVNRTEWIRLDARPCGVLGPRGCGLGHSDSRHTKETEILRLGFDLLRNYATDDPT